MAESVEQRFRLFQITRVKPVDKSAVDRSEKVTGLVPLAPIAPETGHASFLWP
jgi:hypothetical protein